MTRIRIMSAFSWVGHKLYLGSTLIGEVVPPKPDGSALRIGPDGEAWVCFSKLPGASPVIGPFKDAATAKAMLMRSADSRTKAMFGANVETTALAVQEGAKLRTVARAIWRAGVWHCDRPCNAFQMFKELGWHLGCKQEDAPTPARSMPGNFGHGSSHEMPPEPDDMIDNETRRDTGTR